MATRDISPLETVITDVPSVVGPPAVTVPVCLECLAPLASVEVVECSLCSAPLCARPECQDGPNHRAECRLLQEAGTRLDIKDYEANNIFYTAVLPLRMWSTRTRDPLLWAKINFLQEEKEGDWTKVYTDVADYIHTRLGLTEFRTEEVLRLTGIKAVNAIDLSQVGVEGTALYGVYPLMNSYCYCNTMYHIDPATKVMKVRAKTAIKAGEEITTRYVVPSMEQPARLEHIWRVWGFICSCARCQSASELGSWYSGVRCQADQCQAGHWLPSSSDQLGCDWSCGDCGASTSQDNILHILARCRAIRDRLESQDPGQGEQLLAQLASYLHPNHGLCVEQKAKLVVNYSKLTDKPAAVLDRQLQLATEVIEVMDIIDPGLTPRRGGMLKYIVDIKMKKANQDRDDGLIDKVEHMRRMKSNMMLMKEMMMCLKYSVVL